MYYLGITTPIGWGHDTAACLVKDNKIIAFAEEERFIRYKHAYNVFFPTRAIKFCLQYAGITIKDVEIGFTIDPKAYWKKAYTPKKMLSAYLDKRYFSDTEKLVRYYFGYEPKSRYIEHHVAHAYSSFPISGFNKGISFNLDAVGQRTSSMIGSFNKTEFKELDRTISSLGYFYGRFTQWLGFESAADEGKVMGLASYGEPKYDLSKFVNFSQKPFHTSLEPHEIEKMFGPRRYGEIQQIHKDVAASVQYTLEKVLLHLVDLYKPDNLCLAGGVALNCVANGKLITSGKIKDIFIQPSASDAGAAIGAAIKMAMDDGHKFNWKMDHIYYGPEFTNEQIEKSIKLCKLEYEYHDDITGLAADLISRGKIIGWLQGRMEGGPRALGNRSILADPRNPKMKDKLNNEVKHREPWRPFCPSILNEDRAKYFDFDHESPFMILAFDVKEEKREEIPAVVHVDGTARPQTVTKEQNPVYYKLLKAFKQQTGVPVLINTSFNIKGEPIVCTPEDAIRCFFGTGIDALIMGNYLLKKKKK